MQQRVAEKLHPPRQVLGQKFRGDPGIVLARVGAELPADEIQVRGELLRRAALRTLAQESRGHRSQPLLPRRVRRRSRFHQRHEAHDRHAALLQQQHRQPVLQDHLLVRRQPQRLRGGSRRHRHAHRQQRGTKHKARKERCSAHGLAFSSACGTSVATVRLFSPKYVRAARCTSSFVTAAKFFAASNSFL